MKLKYNMIAWCMAAGFLSLTACDDEDNWTPGESAVNVDQVYFTDENPESIEIEPGETRSYTFTLMRGNSSEAVSVPLTVSGAAEFEVPSTVEFAEGETEKQITVNFTGAESSDTYKCKIVIPEGMYNSPYTSLTNMIEIEVSVAKWVLFARGVRFTSNYLPGFTADLYKVEGKERYRFVELFVGLDLNFTVEETETAGKFSLYPEGGYNGVDPYNVSAWYFGAGSDDDDYFSIYPKGYDGYYLYWAYMYTDRGGYDYTYINFNKRKGLLTMCYYVYDIATDDYIDGGYDYLNFEWDELEEQTDIE